MNRISKGSIMHKAGNSYKTMFRRQAEQVKTGPLHCGEDIVQVKPDVDIWMFVF